MNIWFILIAIMLLSLAVQGMLTNRFNKYSKVPTSNGMSGAEIAMEIKGYDNGIPYHLSIGVNAVTKTIATIVLLTPPF